MIVKHGAEPHTQNTYALEAALCRADELQPALEHLVLACERYDDDPENNTNMAEYLEAIASAKELLKRWENSC